MAEMQESNQSKAAEVAVKDKDISDNTDTDSLQLLDRLYLYQNNQTGQVAPTARLTTRQLCRILCPRGGDDNDDDNDPSSLQQPQPQRTVTPETQLLAVETSNNSTMSYSNEGWKQAKMVPILQQATSLWYYEVDVCSLSSAADSSADKKSTVKGPVSCRKLAELYFADRQKVVLLDNASSSSSSSCARITKSTRVYSEAASPTWSAIQDVPYLQLALQAFFQSTSSSSIPSAAAAAAGATDEDMEQTEDASIMAAQEYYAVEQQQDQEPASTTIAVTNEKQIKDELEAFLSSTDHLGISGDTVDVEDDEAYESDNGTRYIKDARTGNWVHEALVMAQRQGRIAEAANKSSNTKNINKKQSNAAKSSSSTTTTNEPNNNNNTSTNNNPTKKRKKSKAQFAARNAKNWIYVTGLPSTCTEEQVQDFFSQAGIIELDPETLRPKIKLYRYNESDVARMMINNNDNNNTVLVVAGQCKGDASICFARSESVDLAITLLDEAPFQPPSFPAESSSQQPPLTSVVRVQRAKFERHHASNRDGEQDDDDHNNINNNNSKPKTKIISNAKRKVAKLAAIQARDWDDGEFNGRLTGGRKGLRIIVLKHVFSSSQKYANDDNDAALARLEKDLLTKCQPFGTVEKITIFASNPDGVVIVKFTQPGAASEAIKALDGKVWGQEEAEEATTTTIAGSSRSRTDVVQANFWDGVTDYTVRNEAKEQEEMEKRHDQFGQWLDNQELPEELRLKTEDG